MPVATRNKGRGIRSSHIEVAAWSEDSSSEFEPVSPPGSPAPSSDHQSLSFEDLNLYDPRYGP